MSEPEYSEELINWSEEQLAAAGLSLEGPDIPKELEDATLVRPPGTTVPATVTITLGKRLYLTRLKCEDLSLTGAGYYPFMVGCLATTGEKTGTLGFPSIESLKRTKFIQVLVKPKELQITFFTDQTPSLCGWFSSPLELPSMPEFPPGKYRGFFRWK